MKKLRTNTRRSKNAILLIWIVLTIQVILCISSYFELNLLQTILDGGYISLTEAESNDSRQQIIAVLFIIIYIISAITFIQWFRRAYFNLHILVKGLSHTEGWAAGAWFVPIVSLFKPYQIMAEMFEKTKQLISKHQLQSEFKDISSNSIGIWWTLFIINNIIGHIVFRLPSDTLEEMILVSNINIYQIVIQIPLAILTIKVINQYSELESLLVNIPHDNSMKERTIIDKEIEVQ